MAEPIVPDGCAGVEEAARKCGHEVQVPFSPGRTDATREVTDVATNAFLEPKEHGFRNFRKPGDLKWKATSIDPAFGFCFLNGMAAGQDLVAKERGARSRMRRREAARMRRAAPAAVGPIPNRAAQ